MKKRKRGRQTKPRNTARQAENNPKTSKPQAPAQSFAIQRKNIALRWVAAGIAALALFGSLDDLLGAASWVSYFVANWHDWNESIWATFSIFMGFRPVFGMGAGMVFLVCLILTGLLAVELESSIKNPNHKTPDTLRSPSAFFISAIERTGAALPIGAISMLIFTSMISLFVAPDFSIIENIHYPTWFIVAYGLICLLSLTVVPFVYRGQILHVALLSASIAIVFFILTLPGFHAAAARSPSAKDDYTTLVVNVGLLFFPGKVASLVAIASPRFWNHAFIPIWLTLIGIIVLNYIASIGLSLKPPT